MRSEQELSAEQISTRYRSQRVPSPPALDERVLELARERAPQKPQRSWQRAPAWSGVAVVCGLLLLVPGLLESPAPVTGIVDLDDNLPVAEAPLYEFSTLAPAAMRKSGAALLSYPAAPEPESVRQREQLVETAVRAADPDPDVGATATAAPTMTVAVPAITESGADAAAGDAAINLASEVWLQTISELLAAGDIAGAQAEFTEFRRVYPELAVDAALLERLVIKP